MNVHKISKIYLSFSNIKVLEDLFFLLVRMNERKKAQFLTGNKTNAKYKAVSVTQISPQAEINVCTSAGSLQTTALLSRAQ